MKIGILWVLPAVTMAIGTVWADAADDLPRYDPTKYSQEVTACDVLANHPNDLHKVAVGYGSGDIRKFDRAAAAAACKVALERDPTNPRLAFSASRTGVPNTFPSALAAGYPHAVLVASFTLLNGQGGGQIDKCLAGKYALRTARDGRVQPRFVWFALAGEYDNCPDVTVDLEEMLTFLDASDKNRLVDDDITFTHDPAISAYLRDEIKARMSGKKKRRSK